MEKGTVLLIDDDPDMLLITQRVLGRAGYKFISARNGSEGLQKIKAENPDLVLLDYLLPDINGEEFLQTLAQDEEYRDYRDIPVAIVTAKADRDTHVDRFFELGLKAYLIKPFGHRELVNVIDNLLRISRLQKRPPPPKVEAGPPAPSRDRDEIGTGQAGPVATESFFEELKICANSIAGLSRMLLEGIDGEVNNQQRMDVMAIYNSSRNLLKLMEGKLSGPSHNSWRTEKLSRVKVGEGLR